MEGPARENGFTVGYVVNCRAIVVIIIILSMERRREIAFVQPGRKTKPDGISRIPIHLVPFKLASPSLRVRKSSNDDIFTMSRSGRMVREIGKMTAASCGQKAITVDSTLVRFDSTSAKVLNFTGRGRA